MRIAGIENNSLVDYPGKISMLVFTEGCNLNCYYCHNRDLIKPKLGSVLYTTQGVIQKIKDKGYFLDAIVITGGEPTLQPDLCDFIKLLKRETSLLIKLDTNGTEPDVIKKLLNEGLIDYCAMDIKAPKDKYSKVCLRDVDAKAIDLSISMIMNSGVDYEFRTTFAPYLTKEDIVSTVKQIKGAKSYNLQQYVPPKAHGKFRCELLSLPPHGKEYILQTADAIKEYVHKVNVRGI